MTSPLNNLTDTWNNSGTTFTALKYNVTNTASAAGSLLLDFQLGGISKANIGKSGSFNLYNTNDGAGNYERGVFDWTTTSNVLTIGSDKLGTGSTRTVNFIVGGTLIAVMNLHSGALLANTTEIAAWGDTFLDTTNKFGIASNAALGFSSTTSAGGTMDLAVTRSAAGVIAFGSGAGGIGDASACIKAKTKAGAPTTSDVPSGTWALIRDTSGATTKLYYNNAGTLMSVALT